MNSRVENGLLPKSIFLSAVWNISLHMDKTVVTAVSNILNTGK